MDSKTFYLVSLGCAKNSVDSESMAQLLEGEGYRAVKDASRAGVVIVNTCGFIAPARAEAYEVLHALAEAKRPGQLLIAAGCLTQRYGQEVVRQVPGIDGVLGTRRWMDIVEIVRRLRQSPHPVPLYHLPDEAKTIGADPLGPDRRPLVLRASVAGASAYLKIADGCRRPCAFCAIPLIKGTVVSRPLETLLDEAERLSQQGVRELILIAQDTTDYGSDLGMQDGLSTLLERLTERVPAMDWIRILYAYPGYVTDRLIELMAEKPQILPYLDIPLQHAHPATLLRMRRPANLDWVRATLAKMRAALPGLAIRTTFIVGYPGETEAEFQALLDFVAEMKFDRLGAFQYSFEPGTPAEALGDPIPAEVKEERYQRLMELQQTISLQKNQALVGQTLQVLIDGNDRKKRFSIGRSYRDAPEVDGVVLVEGLFPPGTLLPVRVTGALTYDLTGVPAA
ncbi:MAG: 30S ribosomal protein S12 methylthiotransferase RimO [Anaerolineales bacterium]